MDWNAFEEDDETKRVALKPEAGYEKGIYHCLRETCEEDWNFGMVGRFYSSFTFIISNMSNSLKWKCLLTVKM